jgi:hypothetical protein
MRDLAAAEHTVHAKLAYDGRRVAYPQTTHNNMFLMTEEVCNMVDEVADAVAKHIQAMQA